jgi:DNA mismatch repair ATPase MutS
VTQGDGALVFEGLAHPLLPSRSRVANDLITSGPGTALVITGSNMAGKSTLLRAIGVNIALALAGGPVCARQASVPRVRLRASMRADDSLQSGASYFHAELTKLRRVVDTADAQPPVFFLLDELLRGTNARARHLGARAVLLHLIARHGCGVVATHDAMLGQLETEQPGRVQNFHFTDVMNDGEMTFDYTLHPGIVRTSNALRLLAMAGIDVPESLQNDNAVDGPAPASRPGHPRS